MRIQILFVYFERPNSILKNALPSILEANKLYQNWELSVIDDGSVTPAKPIVEQTLGHLPNTIRYYNSNMSIEEKKEEGSIHGELLNQAMDDSDADISFVLCDDDMLHKEYLLNLNKFFTENERINSCHSQVIAYRNDEEGLKKMHTLLEEDIRRRKKWVPYNDVPRQCAGKGELDMSQVAWKTKCKEKARFPHPKTTALDGLFYEELNKHYGLCEYSGFFSQYKNISRLAMDKKVLGGRKGETDKRLFDYHRDIKENVE